MKRIATILLTTTLGLGAANQSLEQRVAVLEHRLVEHAETIEALAEAAKATGEWVAILGWANQTDVAVWLTTKEHDQIEREAIISVFGYEYAVKVGAIKGGEDL